MSSKTKAYCLTKLTNDIMRNANGGNINDMIQDWSNTKFAKEYVPIIHSNNSSNTIANNCIDTIRTLPNFAHFRKPLIKVLFKNICQKEVAEMCCISESTVSQAFKALSQDFDSRYGQQKMTRQRISTEEKELIKEALSESCPIVSGKHYRKQSESKHKIYEKYLDFMENNHQKIRCEKYILSFRKALKVRPERRYYGHFECSRCKNCEANIKELELLKGKEILSEEQRAKIIQINKDIEISEVHKKYAPIQREKFREMQKTLLSEKDRCIVVQDFTKIYPDKVGNSTTVVDMVVVILYNSGSNIEEKEHVHIMAKEKSSFVFVANAWINVLCSMLMRFRRWDIWSDGCSKQFKNKYTQLFYSWLQSLTGRTITYNFYTSWHAHNICDGHAATIKQAIKR